MRTKLLFLSFFMPLIGIAQIALVRDFAGSTSGNPGKGNPENCYVYNDRLYFTVDAADGDTRLYESDGTNAGSVPLKYGAATSARFISTKPEWAVYNNALVFFAYQELSGGGTGVNYRLFVSSGTQNNNPFPAFNSPSIFSTAKANSDLIIRSGSPIFTYFVVDEEKKSVLMHIL